MELLNHTMKSHIQCINIIVPIAFLVVTTAAATASATAAAANSAIHGR